MPTLAARAARRLVPRICQWRLGAVRPQARAGRIVVRAGAGAICAPSAARLPLPAGLDRRCHLDRIRATERVSAIRDGRAVPSGALRVRTPAASGGRASRIVALGRSQRAGYPTISHHPARALLGRMLLGTLSDLCAPPLYERFSKARASATRQMPQRGQLSQHRVTTIRRGHEGRRLPALCSKKSRCCCD